MTVGLDNHRATTDAEGRYLLSGLLASRYQVQPTGPAVRGKLARPASHSIDLGSGEERLDLDFAIVDGVAISGWVDPGTLALSECEVQAQRASDGQHSDRVHTGEDGSFELAGLAPEPHSLILLHQGNEIARVSVGAAGATNVRLVAPR
jgi:hypothetical protein